MTYGFYVSGSNYDEYSFLQGTFTFDTVSGASLPPPAPTGLAATTVGNGAVNLSWTAPTVNSSAAPTSYEVFAGTSPGGESATPVTTVNAPGTSTTVTALANGSPLTDGTTYYFTVASVNANGTGAASNEATATPAVLQTNTSWLDAQQITLSPNGTGAGATGTTSESIDQAGETLWYDFPIQPDEQVQVSLSSVPADYSIAAFSDISQAFAAETSSTPNLLDLGAEVPGSTASPSAFSPSAFSPSAFSPSAFSPSAFSPSAFSPSAFSPSAFSPSAFSPSAFSPSAFSPSAFSPSAFSPSAFSPSAFSADYADAQIDSLLAVSTAPGAVNKSVNAATWNNTGNFYIRISGNNGAFASGEPYTLTVTTSGSPCSSSISPNPSNLAAANLLQTTSGGTISGAGGPSYQTVIVDDSTLMPAAGVSYSGQSALYTPLQKLAGQTNGVVVDVGQSSWVDALASQAQAPANAACPYAENLEATAIQDIINTYRTSALKYVVIVGDDDVIPFFRYPDNAGLAPESDYEPPLSSTSSAEAALQNNDYLSDDQYGAETVLNIQGTTVPLATAAVGRLVESPADIYASVESYVNGQTAINAGSSTSPGTSLVSGYDFMQPPASEIASTFGTDLGATPTELITNQGVPATTTGTPPSASWTASQLSSALFGTHHDLVFLGAHFSANNLLAADDTSTITTNQFASQVGGTLQNSLVISPGCHSGYNIDAADGVPGVTDDLAWPQAFTEAGATLIAGTGYQYGDTNYVAYSDQFYVDLAQQLGYQPGKSPGSVSIGAALTDTKLQYLAGLDQLNGLQEKALLQVTLYGLPMLGLQEPDQQAAPGGATSAIGQGTNPGQLLTSQANSVASNPGQSLGLEEANLNTTPVLTATAAPSPNTSYTYDSGPQGEVADPGGPVLPLQIEDVNVANQVLRGVGFWGGTYTDTPGTTPLTGDPATDTGSTSLVQFASPAFFPQTLWNPNYFPTLVNGGDTELAMTPVQYESDSATTNVMRSYNDLDLHLFYSDNTSSYSGTTTVNGQTVNYTNVPALAAPPTISDVTSTVTNGDQVVVSAHVSGEPAAGIQEVWVTYTGTSAGPLHGTWQSVDLQQSSSSDSTLWTGVVTDANPAGVTGNPASDMQFMVQAANGVGEVSMDNNDGYFFTPSVDPGTPPAPGTSPTSFALSLNSPTSGPYQGTVSVSATLTPSSGALPSSVPGEDITFDLGPTTVSAPIVTNSAGTAGTASATVPLITTPGTYTLSATYSGDSGDQSATASTTFKTAPASTGLTLSAPSQITAGQVNGVTATLTTTTGSGNVPLQQKPVYFVISGASGPVLTTVGTTNASGLAQAGP